MPLRKTLARAEKLAIQGNNESQDSQAVLDEHMRLYGIGLVECLLIHLIRWSLVNSFSSSLGYITNLSCLLQMSSSPAPGEEVFVRQSKPPMALRRDGFEQ